MERKYNREELEQKKLVVLKEIARNDGLPTSGKKSDLIERILTQQTYFELLPKDVLNIVNKYEIENNENNILLKKILLEYFNNERFYNITQSDVNKIFDDYNLNINYNQRFKSIKFEDVPFITDYTFTEVLSNILRLISNRTASNYFVHLLNNIFQNNNSKWRIVQGTKNIEIGKIEISKIYKYI